MVVHVTSVFTLLIDSMIQRYHVYFGRPGMVQLGWM